MCRVPSPPLLSLCPWARFKSAVRLCPVPGCAPYTPKQQGLTRPDSERREGWAACKDCVRFLFGKVRCCLGHARKEGEFCHVKSNLHVLAHSSASCPAQNGEGEERRKKKKCFAVLIPCPGQLGVCCLLFHRCIPQGYSCPGPGPSHLPPLVLIHVWEQGGWKRRRGNLQTRGVQPPQLCSGVTPGARGEQNQGWVCSEAQAQGHPPGHWEIQRDQLILSKVYVRFKSTPLPHRHTLLQSFIFPRFLFRSVICAAALHGFCH